MRACASRWLAPGPLVTYRVTPQRGAYAVGRTRTLRQRRRRYGSPSCPAPKESGWFNAYAQRSTDASTSPSISATTSTSPDHPVDAIPRSRNSAASRRLARARSRRLPPALASYERIQTRGDSPAPAMIAIWGRPRAPNNSLRNGASAHNQPPRANGRRAGAAYGLAR